MEKKNTQTEKNNNMLKKKILSKLIYGWVKYIFKLSNIGV